MQFLNDYQDYESPDTGEAVKDIEAPATESENPPAEGETTPSQETGGGTSEINPSVVEDTEVKAAEIKEPDTVVVQADDVLAQTIDGRLAGFYQKQQELENTIKIMLQEITDLKANFSTIETAIDTAAETSPTVEKMSDLINQL